MSNSFVDPVVAEIHAVRQKMLSDAGGDVNLLMRQVVDRQNQSGRVIIRQRLEKRTEQQTLDFHNPQHTAAENSRATH